MDTTEPDFSARRSSRAFAWMPTERCSSPVEATCSNFGLLMTKVLRLCARFGSSTRMPRPSSARGTRPHDRTSASELRAGTSPAFPGEGPLWSKAADLNYEGEKTVSGKRKRPWMACQ